MKKLIEKSKILQFFRKINEKLDENLIKFLVWNGAKVCESCRSRKMLQNEYLDVKIGFDTAGNEPSQV